MSSTKRENRILQRKIDDLNKEISVLKQNQIDESEYERLNSILQDKDETIQKLTKKLDTERKSKSKLKSELKTLKIDYDDLVLEFKEEQIKNEMNEEEFKPCEVDSLDKFF